MASKISYYIIFGIMTLVNGKPANKQDSVHIQNELQKFLEYLYQQQGKYNIGLSRYDDGLKTEYEVKINSNDRDDDKEIPYNHHQNNNLQREGSYLLNIVDLTNTRNFNPFLIRPSNVARQGDSKNNISNCMQRWGECKDIKWDNGETRAGLEDENAEEVLEFLNELDKNMESNGYYKIENYDRYRNEDARGDTDDNDRNYKQYLDDDYSNGRDDNYLDSEADRYRNTKGNLRCIGDRCSKSRNYRDDDNRNNRDDDYYYDDRNDRGYERDNRGDEDRNERNNLRCIGDRCGRNRNNRDNDDWNDNNGRRDYIYDVDRNHRDNMRCVGDRCSRSRNDRYDDERNDRNNLRCIGNRCGISINDRDDDDDRDKDRIDRNDLRCIGDRCGRSSDDRDDDNRNGRDDYRNHLRCIGDRCGRSNDDDRNDRDDDDRNYRYDDNRNDRDDDDRNYRHDEDRNDIDDDDRNYRYYDYRNDRDDDDRNDSDDDDRNDRDDDYRNDRHSLRCVGDGCGKSRDDENDEESLEMSDLSNVLNKLVAIDDKYVKDLQLKENGELNKAIKEREALLEQIKNMLPQNNQDMR